MTSFPPDLSAATTRHATEAASSAADAVAATTELADWRTSVADDVTTSAVTEGGTTSSGSTEWTWMTWMTTPSMPITTDRAGESAEVSSGGSSDDAAAYRRLTNLAIIVAVYSAVLVAMFVLACRRRRTGLDYRPLADWTDLEVCGGGDDEIDDSSATSFQRYWSARREVAERQRLLDSWRVDNISSVAAGHLIDRLPEHVV